MANPLKSSAKPRKKVSAEVCARRSQIMKALWSDPERKRRWKAALSSGLKRKWRDPSARKKMLDNPKRLSALQRAMKSPEFHTRHSAAMKSAWSDPEKKARWSEAIKAGRLRSKQAKLQKMQMLQENLCGPCAAGNHLACDGGTCACTCADELDQRWESEANQ
jgi:hypothetical protein